MFKSLSIILIAASIGIFTAIIISKTPVGKPYLAIDMTPDTRGDMMLFYKLINGSYHGDWRSTASFGPSRQVVNLPFTYEGDPLRIDPPDRPGSYIFHSILIKAFWVSIPVTANNLRAAADIETVEACKDGTHITTRKNAIDPQLSIDLRQFNIHRQRRICQAIIALSTTTIILLMFYFRRLTTIACAHIEQKSERSFRRWERLSPLRDFGIYLAIAVGLNIFLIANFNLSIDDEYAAMRTDPAIWVSQGRWGVYLLERYCLEQPTMPSTPNILFCIGVAMATAILTKKHGWHRSKARFLIAPFLIAFPTWWFIQEFYANLPAASFGFLCVSIAASLATPDARTTSPRLGGRWGSTIFASLLLSISISFYQSLALLYCAIPLGIWMATTHHHRFSHLARCLVKPAIVGILGMTIYLITNCIFQQIISHPSQYLEGLWRPLDLLGNPLHVVASAANQAYSIYGGGSNRYGVDLSWLACIPAATIVATTFMPTPMHARILHLFAIAGLLTIPFLLNLITGGLVETRTLIAVPYIMFVLVGLTIMHHRPVIRHLGIATACLGIVMILKAQGLYAAATWLATSHDRFLANDLVQRIGATNPHLTPDAPIIIDVLGTHSPNNPYPSPSGSTMNASFFDWDRGNIGRMVVYMRLLGTPTLQIAGESDRTKARRAIYPDMPIWPATGSVRWVDGICYIKLSAGSNP